MQLLFEIFFSLRNSLQRWAIAALLQAIGFNVGLCGLANVLQCGMGLPRTFPNCPKGQKWGEKIK